MALSAAHPSIFTPEILHKIPTRLGSKTTLSIMILGQGANGRLHLRIFSPLPRSHPHRICVIRRGYLDTMYFTKQIL